jgi:hypothetical protein
VNGHGNARAASSTDRIAEAVEAEIERLKELRPALGARIDRAASILVGHLSSRKARILVVRIGGEGRPRVLVASRSPGAGGAVYVVDPADWSCSCPDYHRRGGEGVCKHAIAVYVLWRAGRRPRDCGACHGETVHSTVEESDQELTEPVPRERCGRSQEETR